MRWRHHFCASIRSGIFYWKNEEENIMKHQETAQEIIKAVGGN